MTNLGPLLPRHTYTNLLQVPGGATGTLTAVESGAGTAYPFQLSTAAVNFTGSVLVAGVALATLFSGAAHTHAIADTTGLQAALDAKAPLASPALTGTPTAPTAAPGTNTTQVSTTAFVQAAVAALVDSSPGALDTLNELAAALGDDAGFAATVTTALAGKQPLDSDLTALAALTTTAFGRGLLELVDAAALRTVAALGTLATQSGTFSGTSSGTNTGDQTITLTGDVTGTGTGSFAATVKNDLALGGNPTAATQTAGNNSTRLATTAFVAGEIAALIDSSPGALDTLNELAAALGDDANFAGTVTTALAGKQPLDATLTALAGLSTAADKLSYFTGVDTSTVTDLTSFARTLLDDASAAVARGTLGVAVGNGSVFISAPADGTVVLTSYAQYPYTIDLLNNLKTGAGTLTLAVQINGTNVTGLGALAVTTTPQTGTATAANAVAVGDRVTWVMSAVTGATNLECTAKLTR